MLAPIVAAFALVLPAVAAADTAPGLTPTPETAATAVAVVKPPACPPYVIVGVYHPSDAIKANGCVYVRGIRGPIIVGFYATAAAVLVAPGQAVRFQPGRGYYAYPP